VILGEEFFDRPSPEVARDLIGKILWRAGVGGGRLSEVEAYLPEGDAASHAARGQTPRNRPMFSGPGHIYVFLNYGVHNLLNIVCDEEGVGSAVLIRSYEPLEYDSGKHSGACGPGRVGRTLGVSKDMSGARLGEDWGFYVLDDGCAPVVDACTRIGLSDGQELPLRYCLAGSTWVTKSPRRNGGKDR